MTDQKEVVELRDILDFAYCPLRVWWRRQGAGRTEAAGAAGARHSPEQLLQKIMQQALFVYHRHHASQQLNLREALRLVWQIWLARWGLAEQAEALETYRQRRAALAARFAPGGAYRRADGSPYQRPTWTRQWAREAERMGLSALQQQIDALQGQAGLAPAEPVDGEGLRWPLGLAEVYARSFAMASQQDLPAVERIEGVNVPLQVELLAHRVHLTADLVVRYGHKTPRGRPPAGGSPKPLPQRVYELHLYDEMLPHPLALARDLRILALAQAVPLDGAPGETGGRTGVLVRHLPSGSVQEFHPSAGEGLDVLAALAAAVSHGLRAGVLVPRLLSGWQACGECGYRGHCYTEPGVMQAFNPPRMTQIESGQALYRQLQALTEPAPDEARALLEAFLRVWAEHPALSARSALHMLNTLEASR